MISNPYGVHWKNSSGLFVGWRMSNQIPSHRGALQFSEPDGGVVGGAVEVDCGGGVADGVPGDPVVVDCGGGVGDGVPGDPVVVITGGCVVGAGVPGLLVV